MPPQAPSAAAIKDRKMRIFREQKGVTLLELIIGLVLFGIIALGFTKALVPSLQLMFEHSDAQEDWLHQARSCAEALVAEGGVGANECNNFCNNVAHCNNSLISCNAVPDPDPDPDPVYCQITISAANNNNRDIVFRLPIQ